ncbi:MAG TPA: hypothetical protein VFJ57_00175 [Solirubrobacterales bacterium]|nr:hypothetical protein [Solirubrobacterales bacterium]
MSSLRRLVVLAIACFAAVGLAVASASAAPRWSLTVVHGPQNIPPSGVGQYVIQAYNTGEGPTVGTYSVKDTLPPGFVALAASGPGWGCSGVGTTIVTCASTQSIPSPGESYFSSTNLNARAVGEQLVITVRTPATPGSYSNSVSIAGGAATGALLADATEVGAPAGFGFSPGSFRADAFDRAAPSGDPVYGTPARQAGSHPFELRVGFNYNLALGVDPDDPLLGFVRYTEPDGNQKTLETRLPAGLIGNPQATPRCPAELLYEPGISGNSICPPETQVGSVDLRLNLGKKFSRVSGVTDIPVYNMAPPEGAVAALAFSYLSNPAWILVEVDPADHYSVVARVDDTISALPVRGVDLSLWGVPADPGHDALRVDPLDPSLGDTAYDTPSTAPIKPLLTLPSQCDTGGAIRQRADSWQNPGAFTPWQEGATIQASGCDDPRFSFEPSISIQPTSDQAASPTGLNVELSVPQKDDEVADADDLYAQNGKDVAINTPPVRNVVTQLPAGMAVNPSVADGLAACSPAQIGLQSNDPVGCPENSKLGTVEVETPLLAETMHGFVYQATQGDNPFGSTLGLYAVAEAPGVIIKLPGRIEADPETGQLTTSFSDNPQLPFSHFRLHIWGGDRAPLVNPPTCGSFQGSASVSSWNSSLPTVQVSDTAQITSGPGGSPCVGSLNARPFAPGFDAKSLTPTAGAFSAFALEVSRPEGSQELSRIETILPPGLIGRLAGIPYCADSSIAAISAQVGSGAGERLSPHCLVASLVGHVDAGAGAGPLPFHNPGSIYLAGPYKGAPLSLAIVTPVIGGPLDLGNVVVRVALYVDPTTAQIRAVSDPLPSILAGIPLNLRSVRVSIDRPSFTLNPTSCDPMSVRGSIGSLQGATAGVSDRFQVGGCAALAFKPKLSLRLQGGSRRGDHPALRATLRMPAAAANIGRTSVALPHSEFLAQNHIRTVCTRVQFAAGAGNGAECPKGSIYGRATAVTPLLDEPLSGPVFLRSNPEHELPDLVAALHGQIDVDLVGRIDSKNGGIRTTFDSVPDAPVSKFVLQMQGGRKGLLENSRNLCRSASAATVLMDAHSGKTADSRPVLAVKCGGKSGRQ